MDVMETTMAQPGGTYRVTCGWCGKVAEPPVCASCGRDPEAHWFHLGQEAPKASEGRPGLDADAIRVAYSRAVDDLREDGREPTVEAIAERLDRSPRTIRDWRRKYGLR